MDGCIKIMVDFNVDTSAPYANIGHPITQLRRLHSKHNHVSPVNSGENETVDMLVCSGHFHSLKVFQHGKVKKLVNVNFFHYLNYILLDWHYGVLCLIREAISATKYFIIEKQKVG